MKTLLIPDSIIFSYRIHQRLQIFSILQDHIHTQTLYKYNGSKIIKINLGFDHTICVTKHIKT